MWEVGCSVLMNIMCIIVQQEYNVYHRPASSLIYPHIPLFFTTFLHSTMAPQPTVDIQLGKPHSPRHRLSRFWSSSPRDHQARSGGRLRPPRHRHVPRHRPKGRVRGCHRVLRFLPKAASHPQRPPRHQPHGTFGHRQLGFGRFGFGRFAHYPPQGQAGQAE